jgi:stage II sporulation protein P
LKTETDFLNIRDAGNTRGKIIGKALPGEQYLYISEKDGWLEIILTDGKTGWVIKKYVKLLDGSPINASD